MNTMPYGADGFRLSERFAHALPEEEKNLADPVSNYFCYLETNAYKIAHYFGFLAGDSFLHFVEPGYVPNLAISSLYAIQLRAYLNINLPSR